MTSAQIAPLVACMPPSNHCAGITICNDPPIFYFSVFPQPLEIAAHIESRLAREDAVCIVGTNRHLRSATHIRRLLGAYRDFSARHTNVTIIVASNTYSEMRRLARRDMRAVMGNQCIFIDEGIFRPLHGIDPKFDAVNHAPPSTKAWPLLQALETWTYVNSSGPAASQINANRILAQSRVGLCLSTDVRAVSAAVECLLAGLPVVTVPQADGQDQYFHVDTAIKVRPDPRQIRDCVELLKARNMSRDYVRSKSLELIKRDRERFGRFLDDLREDLARSAERSLRSGTMH